ncbi:CLUMA_CG016050, isoform A [Clunio marinus]|uniref:CLUMA_CG016050, isoform A n=1 Tax=Clunio marinus TaxID=568069 RepID=A0A1J1IRE3_9DIPT|nr:CLUMA_CG016050, isoform A [Clunio marinus]
MNAYKSHFTVTLEFNIHGYFNWKRHGISSFERRSLCLDIRTDRMLAPLDVYDCQTTALSNIHSSERKTEADDECSICKNLKTTVECKRKHLKPIHLLASLHSFRMISYSYLERRQTQD